MRPASIVLFEKLYLLSIVVSAIGLALGWDQMVAAAGARPGMPAGTQQGLVIGSVVFTFLIAFVLLYFIARRASNIAKWVFVVLAAYGVFAFVTGLSTAGLTADAAFLVNALSLALTLYCAWLLFRPDAKAWFEAKPSDGPADQDTPA